MPRTSDPLPGAIVLSTEPRPCVLALALPGREHVGAGAGQSRRPSVGLDEGVALAIEAGDYQVTSRGDGSAWMYEVRGPASLAPGDRRTPEVVSSPRSG